MGRRVLDLRDGPGPFLPLAHLGTGHGPEGPGPEGWPGAISPSDSLFTDPRGSLGLHGLGPSCIPFGPSYASHARAYTVVSAQWQRVRMISGEPGPGGARGDRGARRCGGPLSAVELAGPEDAACLQPRRRWRCPPQIPRTLSEKNRTGGLRPARLNSEAHSD